jgi:iron complex outermembrane receptor protein
MSTQHPKHNRLCCALIAASLFPFVTPAMAQTTQSESKEEEKPTTLDRVTVTGSLIPQTQIETSTPIMVITAEDISARGFTSVLDVLSSSSLASGGVAGGETSAAFTQGAETVSMFGLKPSYTKYLINGRPMANYPGLYGGTDSFNNVSGIPIDVIERIEILPGGASSLYGSDAIAGVINFILKQDHEGTSLRIRGGGYTEGGGSAMRFSLTNGFNAFDGRLNSVTSVQYETSDPIWGYDRDLTDSYNTSGYSTAYAGRNYLVYNSSGSYLLPDGIDCSNVTSQFAGSTDLRTRSGYGSYCGSFESPGYRTVKNGKEAFQLYNRTIWQLSDSAHLYGEVLYNHDINEYASGSSYTWWGTSSKYGYYYDPDYEQYLNLQRVFSPEDIGGAGYEDILNKDTNETYVVTFGIQGAFGKSWDYDVNISRNETKLDSRSFVRWADPINNYFDENILGPQLGLDPTYNYYPVFQPDYEAFFSTELTPEEFDSFTGYGTAKAKTWINQLRGQLTNSDLFTLPGGSAGIAIAAEAGNEGWDYQPIDGIMDGAVWGQTDVAGSGHRTMYAVMAELRLPLFDMLTASVSGRYDAFEAYGDTVDKATWSAGLEFRPVDSLLVRGKYGTAFKAPTLSDQFQGFSGSYGYTTDYYRCGLEGYTPADTEGCQYDNEQIYITKEGNPDLEPITADTWNVGIVWAPINNFSLSVDYYGWDIENEVDQLSTGDVLREEYYCRRGEAGPGVITCDDAYSWITRGADGTLESVYTPRVNIARQKLELFIVGAKYQLDIGRFGELFFSANYTNKRKHDLQTKPGEAYLDLINDPGANWSYDAGPKWKADGSIGWHIGKWTTTLYANMKGSTPNYLAYATDSWDYVHSSGAKAGKWGTYTTFNLGVDYQMQKNLSLTLQVNNLGNKLPDGQAYNYPGTSTTPYNNYVYSVYGRSIFAELKYNFGG